jgi:hypothetical protein
MRGQPRMSREDRRQSERRFEWNRPSTASNVSIGLFLAMSFSRLERVLKKRYKKMHCIVGAAFETYLSWLRSLTLFLEMSRSARQADRPCRVLASNVSVSSAPMRWSDIWSSRRDTHVARPSTHLILLWLRNSFCSFERLSSPDSLLMLLL